MSRIKKPRSPWKTDDHHYKFDINLTSDDDDDDCFWFAIAMFALGFLLGAVLF